MMKIRGVGMWEKLNDALRSRVSAVLTTGQFLMSRSYNDYTFLLYSVNNDFIEMLYERRTNTIIWIMKANQHDMKKYLDLISIKFG